MSLGLSPVRRHRGGVVRRPTVPKDPEHRDQSAAASVLALQRSAGNRAVTGLLSRADPRVPTGLLLQRRAGKLTFPNLPLGTNASGASVKVKRVLGSEEGYASRWQATAVARLTKAEPAAVVQRRDTQAWCAVEVTAPLATGKVGAVAKGGDTTTGASSEITEVYGLPSLSALPRAIENVRWLKQRQAQLSARRPRNQTEKIALEAETEVVRTTLAQENRRRAALILGVAETEIQWNATSIGKSSGSINITGSPDKDSHGGSHGPVAGQKDFDFNLDLVTAIEIDEPELDDPGRAQSDLFHETHHLMDIEKAKEWVRRYQTEANRTWVASVPGPFMAWLDAQVKRKRLTAGDAQLVVDETLNLSGTTEARANVHTFLLALQLGDSARAQSELVGYARTIRLGLYAVPPFNTPVLNELVAEAKAAYAKLSRPLQADYRTAVKAAIAEHPPAWITALKFFR
jgi:hypothetical protein